MVILALDQSLHDNGWAIFKDGKLKDYGKFSIKKTLPLEVRLNLVQQNILDIIYDHLEGENPDKIVFEGIQQQNNVETFKRLAMVQAAILLLCYNSEIDYTILSPSQWRAINGGGYGRKREEQKQESVNRAKQWYHIDDIDNDVADAINIGHAFFEDNKTQERTYFNK